MTQVEVQVLRGFGKEGQAKRMWLKLWTQIGERIEALPQQEQRIILQDLLAAIQGRLWVFEHVAPS